MAEFQGIIRIAGKDIKGNLEIAKALAEIKGIGMNMAHSITLIACEKLKISPDEKVGNLEQKQIEMLEDIVYHPTKYDVPKWFLDRQIDPETGQSEHLVMSDRDFRISQDIQKEKDMKSYRGVRHMFGHKCRGQRTRTTGRRGKTLGVQKKKMAPAKAKDGPVKKETKKK